MSIESKECPEWLKSAIPDKDIFWQIMVEESRFRKWFSFLKRRNSKYEYFLTLFTSKEEAEAAAVSKDPIFNGVGNCWDGQPATPQTLQVQMDKARRQGLVGVIILSFQDGKWVTFNTYRADQPLPRE